MIRERLIRAELSVGRGQNHFTMSRGSFSYKQHISQKTVLKKTGVTEEKDGLTITFCLPSEESCLFALKLTEENGLFKLRCVCPEAPRFDRFWLSFPAEAEEHFYGCGETYSELDLKGQLVRIFVAEHQNTRRISAKMIREKLFGVKPDRKLPFEKYESYYAQPTFTSGSRYFIHADTDRYSEFDFRDPTKITIYTQEAPVLYAGEAEDFPALSEKLSGLLDIISVKTADLEKAVHEAEEIGDVIARSEYIRDNVISAMSELRVACDEAEVLTARDYWPFPTYGDILYSVH